MPLGGVAKEMYVSRCICGRFVGCFLDRVMSVSVLEIDLVAFEKRSHPGDMACFLPSIHVFHVEARQLLPWQLLDQKSNEVRRGEMYCCLYAAVKYALLLCSIMLRYRVDGVAGDKILWLLWR